jgi:nucleoside-diphosphate-sugar epimerase
VSRVLITGGAGQLGAAVARRLLADPDYDVRISDGRPAPRWMREGCEIDRGDLRDEVQAAKATKGCSHVIHLACFAPVAGEQAEGATVAEHPHALLEHEGALHRAVVRGALDRGVERFLFVSSPLVFERAESFPTPEEHLSECLPPRSARGFARLAGERLCEAATRERGFEHTICRPFGAYGAFEPEPGPESEEPATPQSRRPCDLSELIDRALAGEGPLAIPGTGEQTLTPTHVEDLAAGIVAALGSPAAANEDFNLASAEERSLGEVAALAWQAGAGGKDELELEHLPSGEEDLARSRPSAAKARDLLGWEAQIGLEEGLATLAERPRLGAARARTAVAGNA